ncbi:MAG TPA: hypothetical protein VN957_19875 [Chthoniobacterales bacterium]|nr:hypothetical protein [Chthoniobacterales bacterium]
MTRVLSVYLALQVFIMVIFSWALWLWMGWKPMGPSAFPGSPDATLLYSNAYSGYHWANGLLEGVWLGGIAGVVLVRRASSAQGPSRFRNVLCIAIIVGPIACLIAGHIFESRTHH